MHSRRNSSFISLSFLFLLLAFVAIGADAKKSVSPSPSPLPQFSGNATMEVLQERLYKTNKAKAAKSLKLAYGALGAKNFAKARKIAGALLKDPVYSDYAYWISAYAALGEATRAYGNKKYPEVFESAKKASALFAQIQIENPYSPLLKILPRELAGTELLIGDAYWAQKRWPLARQSFERALQRLVTNRAVPYIRTESLKHYAQTCSMLKTEEFCRIWIQKLGSIYPKISEEMRALTRVFPEASERVRPSHRVNKGLQSYRSPDMDFAAFDTAMQLYFNEKYKDASAAFRRFLDDFPRSVFKYRARYWLAQALSHEQEHDQAQKLYEDLQRDSPLTYYGFLASIASGKSIDQNIEAALPSGATRDPLLQPHELFRLKRAEQLLAEGATELAALELQEFRAREALTSPFLMYLAMLNHEAKNFNTAFSLLGDLIQRGYEGIVSTYTLRMVFPTPKLELIQKYASENRIDWILILSLIKQESGFNSSAVSASGALGLMQLMPATAADTVSEINRSDLVAVEPNIRVGTKYLRQLLTRFNGNIVLALAGYNAGPNAADRWARENSKRGMLEFIESIPYRETREYVSSIIRNYLWYSKRLGQENTKTLSYFWNMYGPPESPPAAVSAEVSSEEE